MNKNKFLQSTFVFSILVIAFFVARATIATNGRDFFKALFIVISLIGLIGIYVVFCGISNSWKSNIRMAVIIFGPLFVFSLIINAISKLTVGLNEEQSYSFWFAISILLLFIIAPPYLLYFDTKKKIGISRDRITALADSNKKLSEHIDELLAANEVLRLAPAINRLKRRIKIDFPNHEIVFKGCAYNGNIERNTLYLSVLHKNGELSNNDKNAVYKAVTTIMGKLNPSISIFLDV